MSLPDTDKDATAAHGSWLPLAFSLALIVLAILLSGALAYWQAPELFACGEATAFRCAADWMRELGPWGVLISLLAMSLAALTMFPSEAAAMANGAVYGPFWGTALTWGGAMIGANIAYAAARAVGPHAIGLLLSRSHYDGIRAWSDAHGNLALMSARLIPLFPYFAINYTAGLVGMRWWPFNWISAIGMLPAGIVFTTMGAKAGEMSWLAWGSVVAGVMLAMLLAARLALRLRGRPGGG